ncbi:hypothetical protein O6H91_02G114500 [Diphasiastrum complanatum]|uniref:Uncharacterized protein n=1 Tax=Diphasiastrum complanatum TaxID=34168 RepID=A0ACC2EJ73_DIPCM|nr:hypothetical protein O6H91_02G114500 [Diphasiastrum complanatum]
MNSLKRVSACGLSERCILHTALASAQLAFAGFEILSRVAILKGVGGIAFSFYRNCIATVLLGVLGLVLEKKKRQVLTFRTSCTIFFCGFVGVTINQVCYLRGLKYTSAIFASAMRNMTPVFTFIIAVLCRLESISIQRFYGQAKVFGCSFAIGGSILLSVYRGPIIFRSKLSIWHVHTQHSILNDSMEKLTWFGFVHIQMESWKLGAIFLVVSCTAFAVFLNMQVPVLKRYPAPISFAAFACLSSVLQLAVLGAIFEPQRSDWAPLSESEIWSTIYAGIIASGFVSGIQSWGVHKGGPVIVAAYQPLETVATAFLSYVFLKETLYLGRAA